jgi:hypothetical protein
MKWFEWITFVITLVPQVIKIITQIEEKIGGENGSVKKEIALNTIESIAVGSGATDTQVSGLVNLVSPLIDSQIASLKNVKPVISKSWFS